MVTMNEKLIYNKVNHELKKIVKWSKEPNLKEDFDLDTLYSNLFKEFCIDMSFGFLYPIFSLVDVLCDSIRHGHTNVKEDYSVKEGIKDLENIVFLLDSEKIKELEDDFKLRAKLNGLYD